MNQAEILNWLDSKAGQVTTAAQVDQFKLELRANLAGLSVEVAGQKPNAVTLLYSGRMGGGTYGLENWRVAEKIGIDSNGQVRTIGQTELGKLLNSQAFKDTIGKRGRAQITRMTEMYFYIQQNYLFPLLATPFKK